jgi:acyl-coenzyme A thioesterase PaaI-like protein
MGMRARRVDSVIALKPIEDVFGIKAAGRLMTEIVAPWVQQLGLLVEAVEASRPPGAPADWQPGVVIRLPYSRQICRDGAMVSQQALLALADTAMIFACAAAWNRYQPFSAVDQTMHFLRPANFDVLADARIARIGRATIFGQVTLSSAVDRRQVGMVSSAYAMQ